MADQLDGVSMPGVRITATFKSSSPEVAGVQAIRNSYRAALSQPCEFVAIDPSDVRSATLAARPSQISVVLGAEDGLEWPSRSPG